MRKIMFICLGLALAGTAWSRFKGPTEGAARFVDTFRWQLMFGYQEVVLSRNGDARFKMVAPDSTDTPITEIADGGYRVSGDTVFIGLKPLRPDGSPEQEGIEADADSMVMVLIKGDNLLHLNSFFGNSPIFVRK
jgi:hypothetical protein